MHVKTSLVRIGNSHGVRIPKAVIEQCGLTSDVEMDVKDNTIVITPARKPRAGWAEAFKRMAEAGDDAPLLPDDLANAFDETNWRW
jgi:antitoxin MazE